MDGKKKSGLYYREAERKERRRRELAEWRKTHPLPEPEVLPGGGKVYPDVLPSDPTPEDLGEDDVIRYGLPAGAPVEEWGV